MLLNSLLTLYHYNYLIFDIQICKFLEISSEYSEMVCFPNKRINMYYVLKWNIACISYFGMKLNLSFTHAIQLNYRKALILAINSILNILIKNITCYEVYIFI
jgi:hypothetical protein